MRTTLDNLLDLTPAVSCTVVTCAQPPVSFAQNGSVLVPRVALLTGTVRATVATEAAFEFSVTCLCGSFVRWDCSCSVSIVAWPPALL